MYMCTYICLVTNDKKPKYEKLRLKKYRMARKTFEHDHKMGSRWIREGD